MSSDEAKGGKQQKWHEGLKHARLTGTHKRFRSPVTQVSRPQQLVLGSI